MKPRRPITAVLLLAMSACSPVSERAHVSPSGKYSIRFYEAVSVGDADQDSCYQLSNNWNPDIHYSSIGGSTSLDGNSIIWSSTEKTVVIQENRFESTRILHLVVLNSDRDCYSLYMRLLEKRHFNHEKAKVVSVSDERVTFQGVNGRGGMEFRVEDLIAESRRQDQEMSSASETDLRD